MPSAYGGQSQQRWGDNTLNADEYMRDFLLTDLSGKVCNTSDARRKGMILVAFFSPADAVSRRTLPYLQKIADAYKESGKLTVWAVSQGDEAETRAVAAELGVNIPLLLDRDLYHSMLYGVTSVPTLFFADNAGMLKRKAVGFPRRALNDVSAMVAKAAEIETPAVIVEDEGVATPAAAALPAPTAAP